MQTHSCIIPTQNLKYACIQHQVCVLMTLSLFYLTQIIPLDIQREEEVRPPFYIAGWRLLLDVSFFIIVTTIGLNIVFGIIVDSFSELRDERVRDIQISQYIILISTHTLSVWLFLFLKKIIILYYKTKIEEDQKAKCFICDLPSHQFDRKAKVTSHPCYTIIYII